MYKVTNGKTVKSAFTMKQAFYYAEDINRNPTTRLEETTIELPDGCVLVYDPSHGDLVCKQPTPITFATPTQAASIFGFFFEGVERGWIDLSHTPQMRDLHDWLVTKQGCKKCGGYMIESKAIAQTFTGGILDFPSDKNPVTFSAGGPGEMVDCMKCEQCGWSVSV